MPETHENMKKCPWCKSILFYTHDDYLVCSRACEYWERVAPRRRARLLYLGKGVYLISKKRK